MKHLSKSISIKLSSLALVVLALLALPSFARAANLGDVVNLSVNSKYDSIGRTNISATLSAISDHAYYFIEDAYWQARSVGEQRAILSKLTTLANEFDQRIYPIEIAFWGGEPNPGVDGDPRLYIVLSNLLDTAGGYFDTSNEYSVRQLPSSNQHEMIFVNIRVLNDERKVNTFLAHEFQHVISFQQRNILRNVDDDIWLNEARSEYAVTLLGYNQPLESSNLSRRISSFNNEPTDSLTAWPNLEADYGQVNLFGEYLVEHFGPEVLQKTMQAKSDGIGAVNEALTALGVRLNFGDVFLRWSAANWLDDVSADTALGYLRPELRQTLKVPATRIFSGVNATNVDEQFQDWQAKWFKFTDLGNNPGFLKFSFTGPQLDYFRLAIITYYGNNPTVTYINADTLRAGLTLPADQGISQIVLIPVKMGKLQNFGANEEFSPLQINLSLANQAAAPVPTTTPVFTNPPTEKLIRLIGARAVYVVDGRGAKHWLKMSGEQFITSGRNFAAVLSVNKKEFYSYPLGNAIYPVK